MCGRYTLRTPVETLAKEFGITGPLPEVQERYCGEMISWLFAGVQKLLQIGVFFLLFHRACSPLFV